MTSEQKKVDRNFIIDNLDKYILDSRDNFYSFDLEMDGDERCYIGKDRVDGLGSVMDLFFLRDFEKLYKEKDKWKVVNPSGLDCLFEYENIVSGERKKWYELGEELSYILTGELGYRKSSWDNYDEVKVKNEEILQKYKKNREKIKQEREQRQEQEKLNQEKQRLKQEQEKITQKEEKDRLEKQQQELEKREKELEEEEQNENPNSIILKKFSSIPNFNTKEKIEALIEPVKNNPNFLQQLKANNIQNNYR